MKSLRTLSGCVSLAALIFLAPHCFAEITAAAPTTTSDWPQWRGPNRDGVTTGPKLLEQWPKEGPPRVWKSDYIPSTQQGGPGSPVVADGKVFLYVSWRHPVGGTNEFRFISPELMSDWGWLQDMPADVAQKIEDARMSPKRPNVGVSDWWAKTEEQYATFLKGHADLDAYIKEFTATLDPKVVEKYNAFIKRRLCQKPEKDTGNGPFPLGELEKIKTLFFNKPYLNYTDFIAEVVKNGLWKGCGYCWFGTPLDRATQSYTDSVVCLDAATGKEIWKKDFDATTPRCTPADSWGAAGTPAIANGKCFISGMRGLYCLSVKDGSLIWKQDHGGGVNASVLISNGVVIGGKPLAAYDAETGKVRWTSNPGAGSQHVSPVLWSCGGKTYVISAGCWGVTYCCIDIETGKTAWELKAGDCYQATPVVVGDVLVAPGTRAFKLSAEKAELLWKNPGIEPTSCPLVFEDHVYFNVSYYQPDVWHCLDLKTGVTNWKQPINDGGLRCSSPIVADGKIIMPLGDGHGKDRSYRIEMLKPTAEKYVRLGVFNPEIAIASSPAMADGRLFVRVWDGLACYDLRAK